MRNVYKDGVDWADEIQCSSLEDTARLCQNARVPLIFVELPLQTFIRQSYPGNVYVEFMRFIQEKADRYGARFLTLEELGINFDNSEFIDLGHLNLKGAIRVTRSLTRQELLHRLGDQIVW
jgi:hypothetical protein